MVALVRAAREREGGPVTQESIVVVPAGRGRFSVRVSGDVDVGEAEVLLDVLVPLVSGGGDIDLDLGGVTFLGSSGLRAVVAAMRAGEPTGARLRVVSASRIAGRVLELTGMGVLLSSGSGESDADHVVAEARRMRSARN